MKKKEDNFLLYVPKRKQVEWEQADKKVKFIFYHNHCIERCIRWLVKKPNVSDMELDELGSQVWLLINGKRSVYDIGQELVAVHGDKCEPVYERLILFLRYLNRRGWISFDRIEKR